MYSRILKQKLFFQLNDNKDQWSTNSQVLRILEAAELLVLAQCSPKSFKCLSPSNKQTKQARPICIILCKQCYEDMITNSLSNDFHLYLVFIVNLNSLIFLNLLKSLILQPWCHRRIFGIFCSGSDLYLYLLAIFHDFSRASLCTRDSNSFKLN